MNTKQFGERVASLRKARGLTQSQRAEQLKVSNKTISRWETGDGYPEITLLAPLAKSLGVTVDYLLAEDLAEEQTSESQTFGRYHAKFAAPREYKHREIPVERPAFSPRKLLENPYLQGNLLHFIYFAVLTGIAYSSNLYKTVPKAFSNGIGVGYYCSEAMGYIVWVMLLLSFCILLFWNIRFAVRKKPGRSLIIRNIGIAGCFAAGILASYTAISDFVDTDAFFRVNRRQILLVSLFCVLVYFILEFHRIYKWHEQRTARRDTSKGTKMWTSLTIFNQISWVCLLLSLCGILVILLSCAAASLTNDYRSALPIGLRTGIALFFTVILNIMCVWIPKAGWIAAVLGLGAGFLDLYDRQYKISFILFLTNLAASYFLPVLLMLAVSSGMSTFYM